MTAESADHARETSVPLTVDDLYSLPDDGRRYELFDGSLLVSPAPTSVHQLVAKRLLLALERVVPSTYEALDTANLKVGDEDFFIPDLLVARAEAVYEDTVMFRPADVVLAVEIVSHSTRKRDRIVKLASYAEAGVPNYWRVEPLEGPALYTYELSGATYRLSKAAPGGEQTKLDTPFPITVDPADWIGPRHV